MRIVIRNSLRRHSMTPHVVLMFEKSIYCDIILHHSGMHAIFYAICSDYRQKKRCHARVLCLKALVLFPNVSGYFIDRKCVRWKFHFTNIVDLIFTVS